MRLFPKRRWLRFSTRTLLVAVTIFCVWLGWQVSIVRERKAVKQLLLEHGDKLFDAVVLGPGDTRWPATPSRFRGWLGDTVNFRVFAHDLSEAEFDRVCRAFPEADVDVYDSKASMKAPPIFHRPSTVIKRWKHESP